MDSDSKFGLWIIGMITATLMTLIVCAFTYNAYTTKVYVDAGYQSQPVLGPNTCWQKVSK